MQAFRHLYALAAEPRCLEAVDVDTRQPVSVPVRITLDPTAVGQVMKCFLQKYDIILAWTSLA